MLSKILHLVDGSRDLSQAEKNKYVVTSWATYKMTNIFTQNIDFFHPGPFWVKKRISSACNNSIFFSAWDKSHDASQLKNFRRHVDHQSPKLLATAAEQFKYGMPYGEYFGGVVAISWNHMKLVNGLSNR